VAINAQLIDELPAFIRCTARYFNIIACELAQLQKEVYIRLVSAVENVHSEMVRLGYCRGPLDDVVTEYQRSMDGEFSLTTLFMELSVVNGSWRDIGMSCWLLWQTYI
jgi:hypothetical protein